MKFKLFMIIVLCALESSWGQNPTGQQNINSIPLNPSVRYGKLSNGFTYYIKKNEEPKNTVELRLVVKAGRIHEDKDQLEYAHLLEHLLAGKTEHFPDIKDHIKKAGGYSNAHTGTRFTLYEARLPSQDKQVVKDGIHLLRDWAQGIKWDEDYIAQQRGAIEGEMRVSDPYRNWVAKTIERKVSQKTGYKIYSFDKRLENIQNFDPDAFLRFYKDWYRPDLQSVIIVGDINVDSMEYEIRRQFTNLKPANNSKKAGGILEAYTIHLDGSNQFFNVRDSIRQELNLSIIRLRPNYESHPKTRGDFKKMLLQQLYALILDSKVKQLKEEFDPPFNNFEISYGVNQIPDKQLAGIQMRIGLETDDLQLMKKQFQRSLTTWKQMHRAFNIMDLEEAKTVLLKNYSNESLMSSNYFIRRYVDHFIYGKAAADPETEAQLVSEILSEIKHEDLLEFIFEYGNLDKDTVFIFFKGSKLNIPKQDVFRKWIKEADVKKIEPLEEERVITSLENLVDIPSINIMEDIELTENEIGVNTVELINGIRLVFKPTTPRTSYYEGMISIQAFRPNTVPIQNRMKYLAAIAAPQVLQYTGAGNYNKFELEKFKRDKGIKLNFRTTKVNQMIYATSKTEDLPELLNLLYLYFNEPRKDQGGFEVWKREKKIQLEGNGIRGSAEFVLEKIQESWYPLIPVLEMEDLQKLSWKQIFQASKKWFSGIENFTFIVTGDFNKDELIPVLINTLSNFPAKKENCLTSKTHYPFPLKKMEENLEFKNIDQVYVRLFFPIEAPRNVKTQITLNLISKALNEHIYPRLRNGSYSPTARGEWVDFKNDIFAFRIDFDSALGNEDMMIDYAMDGFRELKKNGVKKDWVETAIKNELRSYESGFESFAHFNFWPNYLQLKLEQDEDPALEILNYGTLLEHFISLEDINEAINKYMSEEHLQLFKGYPAGYSRIK